MDYRAISKIDHVVFSDELGNALIWATMQEKSLLMEMNLNQKERLARLTKEISKRYHKLTQEGQLFLASAAIILAKIGG